MNIMVGQKLAEKQERVIAWVLRHISLFHSQHYSRASGQLEEKEVYFKPENFKCEIYDKMCTHMCSAHFPFQDTRQKNFANDLTRIEFHITA